MNTAVRLPVVLLALTSADEPGIDPLVFALGFEQDPELFPGFGIVALLFADVDVALSGSASGGDSTSTVPIFDSAGHSLS